MYELDIVMNIIENKKARYEYFIEDTYVCGMSLTTPVLKNIVNRHATIVDRYCYTNNGNIVAMVGIRDGVENIQLLLKRDEIRKISKKLEQKGYTLVPLSIFRNNKGFLKMSIGVCRGKHEYDKRETIKKRDIQREMSNLF